MGEYTALGKKLHLRRSLDQGSVQIRCPRVISYGYI